jgi:hypothetical protein
MFLRHLFDTVIMVAIIALFNIYMIAFVTQMNNSLKNADILLTSNNSGATRFSQDY